MAKKPETKPTTNSWQQQFVRCELDKETKERVKKWDVKYESTMDGLDRMLNDGYKVSIVRDAQHDCMSIFATCTDKNNPNSGFCLTARAPGFLDALKVLVFKHFDVLQEQWDDGTGQKYQPDPWG